MKSIGTTHEKTLVELPLVPECPDCGSTDHRIEIQPQSFQYGREPDAATLTCEVPVYQCNHCGCTWTRAEAEDARTEAICNYLNRLTPPQVRAIREISKLSQAEFSRITGIGEASLSRWETGAQIQNASSDRLLRLISADARNLQRLQQIETRKGVVQDRQFRAITANAELKKRQARFQLRRAS